MDVHLRDLRYFVAVAEELSFTRAAQRLYVSQPVLSKQIRQLERHLHATLLRRDSRGVTLSPAGLALLPHAQRLLNHWRQAADETTAADAHHHRVLRVGLQTSIGRDLYPAAARHFAELAAGWRLATRVHGWTDPSAGLLDHSSDVALLWLPVPAGIDHRVLLVEPRWVALPSRHRLAASEEIEFRELVDEPFIAMPPEAGAMREFWLATADRHGRPAVIGAETATSDETFEAVAAGLGVHLLAAGNAVIYARPGITCRPVRGLAACSLAVAWRQGNRRPEVHAFVAACLEAARSTSSAPIAGDHVR